MFDDNIDLTELIDDNFIHAKPIDFRLISNDLRLARFIEDLDAARAMAYGKQIRQTDQCYKIMKILILNFIRFHWYSSRQLAWYTRNHCIIALNTFLECMLRKKKMHKDFFSKCKAL